MASEIWKDIPGWEGIYQISNEGRCRRMVAGQGTCVGKIVKPKRSGWKGQYLSFSLSRDNRPSQIYAHRAVLIAFVGAPPTDQHQANHRDGNKHNNHVDNLEWVTPFENQRHRYESLGKTQDGEANGFNKYSENIIRQVITLYNSGSYTQREIARITGVDYRYVNAIVHRRAWKSLN